MTQWGVLINQASLFPLREVLLYYPHCNNRIHHEYDLYESTPQSVIRELCTGHAITQVWIILLNWIASTWCGIHKFLEWLAIYFLSIPEFMYWNSLTSSLINPLFTTGLQKFNISPWDTLSTCWSPWLWDMCIGWKI